MISKRRNRLTPETFGRIIKRTFRGLSRPPVGQFRCPGRYEALRSWRCVRLFRFLISSELCLGRRRRLSIAGQ